MIAVAPDPAHPAGHALIRVGGAAKAAGTPGFRVQRDPDWGESTLGPEGWQTSDFVLQPDRAGADGTDLVLHVGWAVCRHLEAGTYDVSLPGAGIAPEATRWPDIVPLRADARAVMTPRAAAPSTPAPIATPAGPVRKPEPLPPVPVPAAPSKPGPARWGAAGLVLLLVAGVGWYAWQQRPPDPADSAQATIPAAQPPPEAPPSAAPAPVPQAPPSLSGLSVPDVIAQAPDSAAVAAEGERRLRGDRKDDGLLLLEAAADRRDASAATALARLYDPVLFQPGGPVPPDARQAARYYRDAARGGGDVTDAREALRRMLQARVQAGDLGADLTLRDFWP